MKNKGGPKKAEKSALHPKSRKASQILRHQAREVRLGKQKKIRDQKQDVMRERLLWFRSCLEQDFPEQRSLSPADLQLLTQRFCERHDNSADSAKSNFKAEGERWFREQEAGEFRGAGLEVPDLLQKDTVRLLREWSGDRKELPKFRLTRVRKDTSSS